MRSRFNSKWAKHLSTDAEKEQFTKTVLASQTALLRLKELFEEDLRELEAQEGTISDFADASWSHKQAFRNGSKASLRRAIDLLTFNK